MAKEKPCVFKTKEWSTGKIKIILQTLANQYLKSRSNKVKEYNTYTVFDLIMVHAPISAQSSNLVRLLAVYFYLLYKKKTYGYSFELPQQVEAIQTSTHNIRFYKKKNK